MRIAYFKTAWRDIVSSPRWVTRFLVLALVSLIPIFGWIVVSGYLLGWARDVAWGARTPLPDHVFDNADGMLYRRGLFSVVIVAVCALAPYLVLAISSFVNAGALTGAGLLFSGAGSGYASYPFSVFSSAWGMITVLVFFAAVFFAGLLSLVGSMRMSIYGRLSAGLQLGRVWAMVHHDFAGLLRIFGMAVLTGIVAGAALTLFMTIVGFAFAAVAMAAYQTANHLALSGVFIVMAAGMCLMLVSLVCAAVVQFVAVFYGALIARALGYWTSQFDVPQWRGQDDPMPFEVMRG